MLRGIVVMFLVNRGGADAVGDRHIFLETAEASNISNAFGLERGSPTIQWLVILRVAGDVAKG